jgi:hypothetical protein
VPDLAGATGALTDNATGTKMRHAMKKQTAKDRQIYCRFCKAKYNMIDIIVFRVIKERRRQ